MSYENAKSTKLLAVKCCACRRPLRDALSVELGIGPVCRERYGYDVSVDESARAEANALVHELAALGLAPGKVERLRALGFAALADRLESLLGVAVRIEADGEYLVVSTPFKPAAREAWRRIPGRRWDGTAKVNRVPASRARDLWALLRAHFAGLVASGRRGLFTIA